MVVYLVRHTSVDVEVGTCYGQTDVDITDTFADEASLVNKNLLDIAKNEKIERFERVFVSPLIRCRKLATFCNYSDAKIDKRILEINFGRWEMSKFDENNDPIWAKWCEDYINTKAPDGESYIDQFKRVKEFMEELKGEENSAPVLIFTHGGVIICASVLAGNLDPSEAFSSLTPYGGIVRLEI